LEKTITSGESPSSLPAKSPGDTENVVGEQRVEKGSLLSISDLSIEYKLKSSTLLALDQINLEIGPNSFVAIVGESGCGKSTLALAIIGLLSTPPARISNGAIRYKSKTTLTDLKPSERRQFRGTEIAMIFQEPLTSLNPVYKVGDQIAEAIAVREERKDNPKVDFESDIMQKAYSTRVTGRNEIPSRLPRRTISGLGRRGLVKLLQKEVLDALKRVRIADPEQVIDRYPFELSGGMRQRVMIAMALSQKPALLIADEPTTALDVTTQAQVLKLMKELMNEVNTSILLITHDLAVASQVADRVVVMYAGDIVEDSDVYNLFAEPLHPYSKGLLSCIPSGSKYKARLKPIPGTVPDLTNPPKGCKYASRCPNVMPICHETKPQLIELKPGHRVACFLYGS
jgi:peptide/nickel transport system ATP-binding protein